MGRKGRLEAELEILFKLVETASRNGVKVEELNGGTEQQLKS